MVTIMQEASPTDGAGQSVFSVSPDQQPDKAIAVTVIVPAYNAATTLSRAVRSVLAQTLTDTEIIIIDDGSTESTWTLISQWIGRDPRIRGMRNTVNAGKSAAMNRAVPLARGKWIAVLDAGDWYHQLRLSSLVAAAERHDADLVADNQFFYDSGANVVVGSAWRNTPSVWRLSFDDFLSGAHPYDTFHLGMLKPVIKNEFLRANGLVYEEQARQGQDFLYLLQFFVLGGKALVSDTPAYYHSQPFGSDSRAWSEALLQRDDYQTAYEINQSYLQRAEAAITPDQLQHLAARGRRLKALGDYCAARGLLEQGKLADAARYVFDHPGTLAYAARRLLVRYGGLSSCLATAAVAARSHRTEAYLRAPGS